MAGLVGPEVGCFVVATVASCFAAHAVGLHGDAGRLPWLWRQQASTYDVGNLAWQELCLSHGCERSGDIVRGMDWGGEE